MNVIRGSPPFCAFQTLVFREDSAGIKTKRHVLLLLFDLTPVHLNLPSYATGKCYRSPLQLISITKIAEYI